jgi:hypothetical protein
MAQRTIVHLEDDIDGGDAAETVGFTLDGVSYEIDLSAKNAAGLRDALATYVAHARKVGGGRGRSSAKPRSSGGTDRQRTADIRAWAKGAGLQLSERGRIPASILEAYDAAH